MPFAEAARTYTILTIGDGLVSQIPALLVSTAAGIVVTKAGVEGTTDAALGRELAGNPKPLALTAGAAGVMALLPGLPMLPFLALAGAAGFAAYSRHRAIATATTEAAAAAVAAIPAPAEAPIGETLKLDTLRLELGYGLLALAQAEGPGRLAEQIRALRRALAVEMGFVLPSVRIQDNVQLPPNTYVIRVKEIEAGRGEVRPGMLLAMDSRGEPVALPGERTTEPAFGLPAAWIAEDLRDEAQFRGYTVVDPASVVTTHLTEIAKDHMPEMLSYAETQKLLDELPREHRKLLEDLAPAQISVAGIQRVLAALLAERVSIRDLPTILEGLSDGLAAGMRAVPALVGAVRVRLARQISESATTQGGYIPLIALSAAWEQAFAESLVGPAEDRQLAMAPSKLTEFMTRLRDAFDRAAATGEAPVLLTSPSLRAHVRAIVERFRPSTVVLSQAEIFPRARIRTVGQV
jgi:flagellar biosynthesis protein FlhA